MIYVYTTKQLQNFNMNFPMSVIFFCILCLCTLAIEHYNDKEVLLEQVALKGLIYSVFGGMDASTAIT